MPLPLNNMSHLSNQCESLSKIDIPKKASENNRIISKGTLNIFNGKNLDKFAQLTVKGLNMYYYDFGIAYPSKSINYPIFLYQVISAPKRVLVVVNYVSYKKDALDNIKGFDNLLSLDSEYADMLIKAFEPQAFIMEDLIPNTFNGLVRTTEIDKAYDRLFSLFQNWYEGMELNNDLKHEDQAAYDQWLSDFKNKFYKEDYGFTATKKFLGEKWAKTVFENYIFS